jgi:hypothetical protein
MSVKDGLLADYDHEIASTRRLLERLPDERLIWSPHPKSMSLGGLANHLSNIPTWSRLILHASSFDLDDAPPPRAQLTTRGAIPNFFDTSTVRARVDMDRSEAEYGALRCLERGGVELFAIPARPPSAASCCTT